MELSVGKSAFGESPGNGIKKTAEELTWNCPSIRVSYVELTLKDCQVGILNRKKPFNS